MGFVNAKLDVNKDENVYYKMQDIDISHIGSNNNSQKCGRYKYLHNHW